MKKIASSTKFVAVLLAVVIVTASCASSTIIQSSPTGAKVFINEQAVGNTDDWQIESADIQRIVPIVRPLIGLAGVRVGVVRDELLTVSKDFNTVLDTWVLRVNEAG